MVDIDLDDYDDATRKKALTDKKSRGSSPKGASAHPKAKAHAEIARAARESADEFKLAHANLTLDASNPENE